MLPADTVQVGLCRLWEVEVDHDVHALDVDTTGEQVGAHQVAGGTVAELVEHSVCARQGRRRYRQRRK